jgi:hypothetical protein
MDIIKVEVGCTTSTRRASATLTYGLSKQRLVKNDLLRSRAYFFAPQTALIKILQSHGSLKIKLTENFLRFIG